MHPNIEAAFLDGNRKLLPKILRAIQVSSVKFDPLAKFFKESDGLRTTNTDVSIATGQKIWLCSK